MVLVIYKYLSSTRPLTVQFIILACGQEYKTRNASIPVKPLCVRMDADNTDNVYTISTAMSLFYTSVSLII